MLNKKHLALCIVSFGLVAAGGAQADGQIRFTGNIVTSTCTVDMGSGPDIDEKTVDFGQYSSAYFANAGYISAPETFDISLSSCSVANTAQIRFVGDSTVDGNSFLTQVDGVGIRISNVGSVQPDFLPNQPTSHSAWSDLSGGGTYTAGFAARLVSHSDNGSSPERNGEIDTVINFSITYD